MKKNSKLFVTLFLALSLFSVAFHGFKTVAFAQEIIDDTIYQDVALNFFETQYEKRNMEYDNLNIMLESDLKNSNDEVVAKALILNRDGECDYIVLNIATSEIDEFSFGNEFAIENFSQDVYYTGSLNYYVREDDDYYSFDRSVKLSSAEFVEQSQRINEQYQQTKNEAEKFTSDGNPLPVTSKTGWNGFYDWSTISSFNSNNDYSNSSWGYLDGINWRGVTNSSLYFEDQNTFNSRFGTNNACGPTALTNMFIWFDSIGTLNKNGKVNALLNSSKFDTFDRFRVLVKHTNSGGTSRSEYDSALKNYAKEQGYDYEIKTGVDTFDEFKDCIENDMPILTSIDLESWGGHAVVVVGYEEFQHSYEQQHTFLWWNWTTTEYKYSRYLRVVDGWSTSNSSRFIDCAGYWDTVTGRGFKIK